MTPAAWLRNCEKLVEAACERQRLAGMVCDLEPLQVRLELAGSAVGYLVLDPTQGSCTIDSLPATEGFSDVTIAGDVTAWARLFDGTVSYVEQVNVAHGAFVVEGSPVHLSWLMPVMSEIFSPVGLEGSARRSSPAVGSVAGQYLEVSGSQVYVETAGSGPAILLIHTAGRDARQWHPVMAALAGRFRLFAPDLPGRGRSEGVVDGNGYLDDVGDLAVWLRAVMDGLEIESYLVAGCSLGGNLALLLGATDPRVAGVLALQGSDFTPTISDGSLAMMQHPRVSLPHSNMNFTMSLVGQAAGVNERASIRRGVDTLNAPAQRADLTAYSHCDTRALMADVTCPVLLFRGEDDWVVSREMVEATAERLCMADSFRLVTASGVGHFPHVEHPELVVDLLRQLHEMAT